MTLMNEFAPRRKKYTRSLKGLKKFLYCLIIHLCVVYFSGVCHYKGLNQGSQPSGAGPAHLFGNLHHSSWTLCLLLTSLQVAVADIFMPLCIDPFSSLCSLYVVLCQYELFAYLWREASAVGKGSNKSRGTSGTSRGVYLMPCTRHAPN